MQRLIGLIALAVLIIGGWWLIQKDGDLGRIMGDATVSGDAAPADAGKQAAGPSAESAVAPPAGGPAPKDSARLPSAETPAGETPAATAAAPEAPVGQPAAESTAQAPAAEAPAPAAGDAPTFDIVRVEPTGETVIAGLAAPNTTVEVLDGPEAVATAEANERGEWALVLDKPLPAGSHDLAIRTTSKDKSTVTLSDQRVAVAVPENKDEQPLVVLSSPDAPSAVMQAPKESEIASAPSTGAGEGAPPAAAAPSGPGTAAAPEAGPAEPAPPASTSGESDIAAAPSEPATPSTSEPPVAASPDAPPAAPSAPKEGQKQSDVAAGEPTPPATAAEEPASAPAPGMPAKPLPQVGVAAVEAETDGSLYIAGTATTKDPVRVYLDDKLIGEAEPGEGGTWLLETKREVAPGDYTIRADQVETGSGKVIVRAEVAFEREIAVATLKQSSESGDAGSAETSGTVAGPMTVIIKRGDNLWRISRELYGQGIRFSTIYQANRDQIRNPDKIYPGQVFVLPAGDTAWQN
jgi:nucleoid-associated protein YgaU